MNTISLLSLLITLSISLSKANYHDGGGGGGFTVDLIHRDSLLSPLYNPTHSKYDRLKNAFLRSISRAARLSKRAGFTSKIDADIYGSMGEYIMDIQIGNPPIKVPVIADTGSDLPWTQCQPCRNCYKQIPHIFEPNASSTYQLLSCQSKPCEALEDNQRSCDSSRKCLYRMSYGDQSYTTGDLAVDTFSFGPTSINNVVFGCGHDNNGTFSATTTGIIGLGGGPLSLVNQLPNVVHGKFSYCLIPPINNTTTTINKIHFGDRADVIGQNVVSTPMVKKTPSTYYYATLETVVVGNSSFPYKKPLSVSKNDVVEGNIVIDSGTTVTFVSTDFHKDLISALTDAIGGQTVQDPQGLFGLCYKDLEPERVPIVTFRFTGADVSLPAERTFMEVQEGVSCLTIVPSDGLAIFGNLLQQNYWIGFDLGQRKISFLPTDCSKLTVG